VICQESSKQNKKVKEKRFSGLLGFPVAASVLQVTNSRAFYIFFQLLLLFFPNVKERGSRADTYHSESPVYFSNWRDIFTAFGTRNVGLHLFRSLLLASNVTNQTLAHNARSHRLFF
jgi:hypothetical protein